MDLFELLEVGRVLSAANEEKLRTAIQTVEEVLASIGEDAAAGKVADAAAAVSEAEVVKDGDGFTAEDFAYAPSPFRAGSWKLRLTKTPGGDPDSAMVGAAAAGVAKAGIPEPDMAAVKATIRTAWNKANPDKKPEDMPEGIKEAAADEEFDLDFVPLIEKAVRKDGTMPIKIIAPGWGSSGYYKPETLMRDGPKVFVKGTKMYIDHQTATEEAERPEGSVRNLAAELVSDARYDSVGPLGPGGKPKGPGLYANARVFEHWRPFVDELAPHIGLSIRGHGKTTNGEAEGRKGRIVEGINGCRSVDLVTAAGAGGEIVQLFESARERAWQNDAPGGVDNMDQLQEAQAALETANAALKEANDKLAASTAENARHREAEVLKESVTFVDATLPKTVEGIAPAVWDLTRARLAESLKEKAPVKDGALDKDGYKTIVEAAVKAEVDYLAKITESGQVRGLGASATPDPTGKAELVEAHRKNFRDQGYSEADATRMADLAVR